MKYFFETEINSLNECVNGRFVANVGKGRHTLVDKIGRVYDFEYYEIKPRPEGFFVVQESIFGLKTLIDSYGNVICKDCKDIDFFSDDGIALVETKDKQKRWMTKTGELFGEQFKNIGCFSGGYGCVQLDDGMWTYVDKNLEPINAKFDRVYPFLHGNDFASVIVEGKYYVINKQFEIVSGPYDHILCFENNDILLCKKNKPEGDKNVYAYYKVDGRQIGEDYKMIFGFTNGIGRVETERGISFIDTEGRPIGNRSFMTANSFGEHMAVVGEFDENGEHTFTFLRRDGTLFKNWYPAVIDETEGLGAVWINNKYYYIDENEQIHGKKGYKNASLFDEGVTHFSPKKGKSKYLTRDFVQFGEEFDRTWHFSEGFGVVKNGEFCDAINKKEIKLSEISKLAKQIEENPSAVLNLPEKILRDPEITYLLGEHAFTVLEIAMKSQEYDDGQKNEFFIQLKHVKNLMDSVEKDVPVYGEKEFYLL